MNKINKIINCEFTTLKNLIILKPLKIHFAYGIHLKILFQQQLYVD